MAEDSDTVKRVLNGDVDSFRILVERYQRPVLSMIRRLIWDSHRSEEIGQDVFVAAFQKLAADRGMQPVAIPAPNSRVSSGENEP